MWYIGFLRYARGQKDIPAYLFAGGSLREYPQHGPAGVVEMESSTQLAPEGASTGLHDVTQLEYGHSN